MDNSRWARSLSQSLPLLAVLVVTISVAWIAYGFQYVPVLFSDDWNHIVDQYLGGTLQWLDWSNRRPLLDAPLILVTALFGLDTRALYLATLALQVLAALQLYGLVRRSRAGTRSFAVLVSLFFLVFPADYTRTWLTMIGGWVVMNLLFLYAHLLWSYANKGAVGLLIAAHAALLASLGIYEAQLGLAFAWALLVPLIRKDIPRRRKLALLSPLALGLAFTVWRVLGVPAIGVADPYLTHLRFELVTPLYRAVFGLGVLAWSWATALREATQIDNKFTLMSLVALSVGLFALSGFAGARKVRRAEPPLAREQWQSQVKKAGALFVLGLALAVAGFMPIVSLYLPSLSAAGSRFNLFALPGASLAIAAFLRAVALLVGRRENHADIIMVCSALPLLVLGVGAQLAVRHDATIAWQHQKQIWAGLADAALNFSDDSAVYFVLPDSQDAVRLLTPWRRTPLSAPWEISSALQVLYGNPTLRGDRLLFGERRSPGNPKLLPDGIIEYWTRDKVPYDRAVFVAYDGHTQTLRVIEDLQTELSLPWSPVGYAPRLRISAPPIDGFPNRWLVDLPALPD